MYFYEILQTFTRLLSYYLLIFTRKSRKTQGKLLSKHIACVVLHAMSINNSSYKKNSRYSEASSSIPFSSSFSSTYSFIT